MISFTEYSKIANNYCICYFGISDEYLLQLKNLKPILEREFPDLVIYIGCKDDKIEFLKECNHVLKISELKIRKNDFAHISELRCNGSTHPIEDFIISAGLTNFGLQPETPEKTTKCVIITKGSHPTKPLEKDKIEKLKRIATSKGMYCECDTDVNNSGLVMGVESVGLWQAASAGVETHLIPTGAGTRLYKLMLPKINILHI